MRDQRLLCSDILERVSRIERYTTSGREAFLASELHQDAVIRSFEVIGEVVKRLDPDLVSRHAQVPWSDFAGFRDILIHQYHHIRLDLVWDFSQEDLPLLKSAVKSIIDRLETDSS